MKGKKVLKLFLIFVLIILITSTFTTSTGNDNNKSFENIKFKTNVLKTMIIQQIPSMSLCVIKDNEIIWKDTYGFSSVYPPRIADYSSIYVLGSISKTFTATAIMQLYEKGLLDLDCDVSCYLPFELRNPKYPDDEITLRMILTHHSGLGDQLFDIVNAYPYRYDMVSFFKEVLFLNGSKYNPDYWCDFKPGEESWYSNFGFIINAIIIEIITGQTFEEYCQENIFQPLKMFNTSFCVDSYDKKELARPTFKRMFLPRLQLFNYDLGLIGACAGLRTNIIDLSHYLIAHMNNGSYKNVKIMNESTINEMHRIQYPNDTMNFYNHELFHGLGWLHLIINNDTYSGYNGGAFGYSCTMTYRKSDGAGLLLLSNGHFNRRPFFLSNKRIEEEYNFVTYVLDEKSN